MPSTMLYVYGTILYVLQFHVNIICYIVSLSTAFIVNTVSWLPNRFRHPELVSILRKADLVTADGMPVVWAARLLGTRLKASSTSSF